MATKTIELSEVEQKALLAEIERVFKELVTCMTEAVQTAQAEQAEKKAVKRAKKAKAAN